LSRPYSLWTTEEVRLLAKHYPTRMPMARIAALLPLHSVYSIRAYAERQLKLRRPKDALAARPSPTWERMKALLQKERLTIYELGDRLGVTQQCVCEMIDRRRVDLFIADWRPPAGKGHWSKVWAYGREPDAAPPFKRAVRGMKAINPFGPAAGLVTAPAGTPGRIYRQDMSINDEELAA